MGILADVYKRQVLPGEKATLRLTSRVPGKAVLFAVDEGVLQITGFATPDPLRELLGDLSRIHI